MAPIPEELIGHPTVTDKAIQASLAIIRENLTVPLQPATGAIEKAKAIRSEIEARFYKYGHGIRNFYYEVIALMEDLGIDYLLGVGDVRSGKSTWAILAHAENPDRVGYYTLEKGGTVTTEGIKKRVLRMLDGSRPNFLILDEIGYAQNPKSLLEELKVALPETKFLCIYPQKMGDDITDEDEFKQAVESLGGITRWFPDRWPKSEVVAYFKESCQLANINFPSVEVEDKICQLVPILSIGVADGASTASRLFIEFLEAREIRPEELESTLLGGYAYYILGSHKYEGLKAQGSFNLTQEQELCGQLFEEIDRTVF